MTSLFKKLSISIKIHVVKQLCSLFGQFPNCRPNPSAVVVSLLRIVFTPPTPTRQNSFVASASVVCIGHYRFKTWEKYLLRLACYFTCHWFFLPIARYVSNAAKRSRPNQSINQSFICSVNAVTWLHKKTVSRTARLLNETLTAALMKYTLHKLKTL